MSISSDFLFFKTKTNNKNTFVLDVSREQDFGLKDYITDSCTVAVDACKHCTVYLVFKNPYFFLKFYLNF